METNKQTNIFISNLWKETNLKQLAFTIIELRVVINELKLDGFFKNSNL